MTDFNPQIDPETINRDERVERADAVWVCVECGKQHIATKRPKYCHRCGHWQLIPFC